MKKIFLFILLFLAASCMTGPYKITNRSYRKQVKVFAKTLSKVPVLDSVAYQKPAYWAGTTNFNLRKPNLVVIHHTAQKSCDQTLKTFTLPRTQVSAHYVICEDGTVHHMLNDYLRAWHAGNGSWGGVSDVNSASIGIELDNDGTEPFAPKQQESLLLLLAHLKKTYAVPTANFIGHSDLAPRRKNDPSVVFDWKKLADNGFGLWYGDTTKVQVSNPFNTIHAFKILGYDTKDTTAVIATFKRKFLKIDNSKTLSEADKKILYSLMNEKLK